MLLDLDPRDSHPKSPDHPLSLQILLTQVKFKTYFIIKRSVFTGMGSVFSGQENTVHVPYFFLFSAGGKNFEKFGRLRGQSSFLYDV